MMSYIYTLVIESQNLSSLPNLECQERNLWLIGGVLVAQGGQELLTAASVRGLRTKGKIFTPALGAAQEPFCVRAGVA